MYVTKALVLLIVVGTLVILVRWALPQRVPNGLKALPGPRGYPVIGNLLDMTKEKPHHVFKELADKYGPLFQVNILGTRYVVISDEHIATELLGARGAYYSDRPPLVFLHELVYRRANIGSSPNATYWKTLRKMGATVLSNNALLDEYNPLGIEQAARLVCDLAADPDKYEYLFERFSCVVTLRELFGKEVYGQDEVDAVTNMMGIVREIERALVPGTWLVDLIPCLKYLPPFLAPFKHDAEVMHNWVFSYFGGLLSDIRKSFESSDAKKPKLRSVAQNFYENRDYYKLSDFEFTGGLGTMYEAAAITTSSSMQAFCLGMMYHPEWQAKVQKEIDTVVGPDRVPNFEDWPNLPCVRATMKEALRWIPPAPGGSCSLSISPLLRAAVY